MALLIETPSGGGGGGNFPPAQWTIGPEGELQIAPDSNGVATIHALTLIEPASFDGFAFLLAIDNAGKDVANLQEKGLTFFAADGISYIFRAGRGNVGGARTLISGEPGDIQDLLNVWQSGKGEGEGWGIKAAGQEFLSGVPAVIADGDVNANERVQMYSGTTNAPKLLVKQKDSAGTLFSGYSVGSALKTSGALSTVAPVSGTAFQLYLAADAFLVVPVTFNPGAATTATCTVALSPDNVTFSTLGVETVPAGVALDGTIRLVSFRVPAAWYVKLTVNAQAVLGTGTYY